MNKIIKRAAAFLLAAVLSLSLAGCYDENLTWAAKKGNLELPIGGYIYYLSTAFNEAAKQVDTETEVLKSEIEGKNAETWIRERAEQFMKQYFWIEEEMARLNLKMTDDDYSEAQTNTTNYWSYFGPAFEEYGIAQNSFDQAFSQYNVKYRKVFETLYGEGGEREVPQSDLVAHYLDTYYNYEYFTVPLTTVAEDDTVKDMTDEEKTELTKRLETVKKNILDGTTTVSKAADDFALELEQDSSYQTSIQNESGMQSAYLPSDFIKTVTTMKENDVEVIEASGYMVVVHLLPIQDTTDEMLADHQKRLSLLLEMKSEEFQEYASKEAANIEGIEFNDKAIQKCKFNKITKNNKNGTLPVEEEESSNAETTSETESKVESEAESEAETK